MMEAILAVPITVIRMMTPIMQPKTIVIQILIQMTQTVLLAIQVHHPAVIDAFETLKSTVIDVLGRNGLYLTIAYLVSNGFYFVQPTSASLLSVEVI